MGVLAVGVGKVEEALPFFKTSLEANPDIGQFWLSYIDALVKLDRMVDAKSLLDQAKSKGANGEAFDQLEQRFNAPNETPVETDSHNNDQDQTRVNALDELNLDQAIKLAKKKLKKGSSEDAKRIYNDILARFPKNKKALDGIKSLSGVFIGKVKEPPQDQLQQLINIYQQGQLQQALDSAKQLLSQFPNSLTLYNIQGAAYAGLGQLDAAINSYKQALKIKPDYAEAHSNMGIALKGKGDNNAAIDSYKQALKIKPDYAEAYNNMGVALFGKGDLEAAIESYKQALKIKPDYAEAYSNMGIALNGVVFSRPNFGLMKIIVSLLDQKTSCRPNDIELAAISLLKLEPTLKELLEKYSIDTLKQSLQETASTLAELPLLLKLMSVCPVADLELESILVDIRSALLSSVDGVSTFPAISHFQSALALQCFTNEYIYTQTDKETDLLEMIENAIEKTLLTGQQPSPYSILCLASYKALHGYEWCELLAVNTDIEEVFIRQVKESKEENRLKANIPILQEINDKVSAKVREQYEENPYPRWVNLTLSLHPETTPQLVNGLNLRIFDNAANNRLAPNILIAGCGTGQHPIETASRIKDCNVLAVDLSLSSLAYAKRKTEELGLKNIDYMQADILDLGELDKKFDIIESNGVLHHMDDPMAGWRALTDCLKAGGLMRIGLYSELARQHIVSMREEIHQSGIGSSDNAMKLFRSNVINSSQQDHKSLRSFSDFYSLSELRDLLFHVQEHRFTIPQIKDCLSQLSLKFCGFESDKIVRNFKLTNTGTDDPYDLDKWDLYEKDNPHSFAGMYQFWCQKVT
jgi:tetratricopeptide (TPR) repeat protein/SAM-dependent methyltransferase